MYFKSKKDAENAKSAKKRPVYTPVNTAGERVRSFPKSRSSLSLQLQSLCCALRVPVLHVVLTPFCVLISKTCNNASRLQESTILKNVRSRKAKPNNP